MTRLTCFALLFSLAGCGGDEDYPALVPVDTVLGSEAAEPAPTVELEAKAAALRARAAALRAAQP